MQELPLTVCKHVIQSWPLLPLAQQHPRSARPLTGVARKPSLPPAASHTAEKVKANPRFPLGLEQAVSAWRFALLFLHFFQHCCCHFRSFLLDACLHIHGSTHPVPKGWCPETSKENTYTFNIPIYVYVKQQQQAHKWYASKLTRMACNWACAEYPYIAHFDDCLVQDISTTQNIVYMCFKVFLHPKPW